MNPWLRRFFYLIFILIWLIVLTLPFAAFSLAARQQIQIGGSEGNHLRIFLIQEKMAEGIGVELARPFSGQPNCSETNVRYFMWVGEPENTIYCQCFNPDTGAAVSIFTGSCAAP